MAFREHRLGNHGRRPTSRLRNTDRIVWQYGRRGVPGAVPGLLNGPDGLDLAPPNSDLVRHAATMGLP